MSVKTIALDAMGGDSGMKIVIPAALKALRKYSDLSLILVGDEKKIRRLLKKSKGEESDRLVVHHASQVVEMGEPPSHALRTKKDSSMRVAINLVKEGRAQACVSAGNTGALMATARFVLKTLPGIDRPAIVSEFPTTRADKTVYWMDLGANIDSSAEHLFQFAVMGSILSSYLRGVERPSVGLLNVGEEDIKGNEQVQSASDILSKNAFLNYKGFVEGNNIYEYTCDVIVCDGFVGNIALKASEGLAKLVKQFMHDSFCQNIFTRLCGFIAMPVLLSFRKKINPARYNGASLLGLNGIVIKSHGGTTVLGYLHAIETAMKEADYNIPQKIRERVESVLKPQSTVPSVHAGESNE